MTDIQERLEHYEAQDRERLELEVEIKDHDLKLFCLALAKNEPDEEFRAAYIRQGQLLRLYREKYGREAEEQLRDQLAEARRAYAEQDEAERSLKELKKQEPAPYRLPPPAGKTSANTRPAFPARSWKH